MTSTLLKITLQPQSPFITPLAGDTLFGQLCWTIRHSFGEAKLTELLAGYTENSPFAVLSNALPAGFIPRPTVPLNLLGYDLSDSNNRKNIKKKLWIRTSDNYTILKKPLSSWHSHSYSMDDMLPKEPDTVLAFNSAWQTSATQSHNSLNRLTNTTGREGGFSPFNREATYHHPKAYYDLYVVLDESRLNRTHLLALLNQIGSFGYGKEASSGAGKFTATDLRVLALDTHPQQNTFLTLGNCAPQGQPWRHDACYYTTVVRFGRHGAEAVYMGNPFKNPVLMATAGAILTPQTMQSCFFVGSGLKGLSLTIKDTVQQGYTPVLPVYFDLKD